MLSTDEIYDYIHKIELYARVNEVDRNDCNINNLEKNYSYQELLEMKKALS